MKRSTSDGSADGRRPPREPGPAAATAPRVGRSAHVQPWLQRTIETQIVPRLMLVHTAQAADAATLSGLRADGPTADDVVAFTELLLVDDTGGLDAYVAEVRTRGVDIAQVCLELISPAARRLGVLWECDACDFAQVTLGLWRLQNLVFELSPELPASWTDRPAGPRRALIAGVPGTQHTLGLLMVSEFFRRAGWDVWSDPSASLAELDGAVRGEWFDVIGLSIGSDVHVDSLTSVILGLRQASLNPSAGVMVGGPVVLLRPELVSAVGADFTARDANHAVEQAESFLSVRSSCTE
jgi:methanogenic corrinoid protein MtbC1